MSERVRLPLWRTISGFAVLGSLAAILLILLPIYVEDYRLSQFMRSIATEPAAASTPDEQLRPRIVERARQLDLPVHPEDIEIRHEGGKLRLLTRYKVQKDLVVSHLDLHFHSEVSTR